MTDVRAIRTDKKSQSHAFEELVCQLARRTDRLEDGGGNFVGWKGPAVTGVLKPIGSKAMVPSMYQVSSGWTDWEAHRRYVLRQYIQRRIDANQTAISTKKRAWVIFLADESRLGYLMVYHNDKDSLWRNSLK